MVVDNPYKLTYSYLYLLELHVTAVTAKFLDCYLKAVTLDAKMLYKNQMSVSRATNI